MVTTEPRKSHGTTSEPYAKLIPLIDALNSGRPLPEGEDIDQVKKLRGYHLPREERDDYLRRWKTSGEFVSPYSNGVYTWHLQALLRLDMKKGESCALHSLHEIYQELREVYLLQKNGEKLWKAFTTKGPSEHAQPPEGKIWVNLRQFVRYGGENPYGWKLRQLAVVVDRFEDEKGQRYARLNTYAFRGWGSNGEARTEPPLHIKVPVKEARVPFTPSASMVEACKKSGKPVPTDKKVYVPVVPSVEKRKGFTLGPHPQGPERTR